MKFDLGSFLESGAIFSIGNHRLLLAFGAHTWDQTPPKSFENASFYFPNFFLDDPSHGLSHPWLNYDHQLEIEAEALLDLLSNSSHAKPVLQWNKPKKREFQNVFNDLQNRFASTGLLKAVPFLSEESSGTISTGNIAHCLINALKYSKKYPASVYGFWNEKKQQGILGATPELLFLLDHNNQTLHSMACAGTAPRNSITSLFLSKKDRREHQLVIDGIKHSLNSLGQINIGQQSVVDVGTIAHLITPISVNLKNNSSFEFIVQALHPTPALGAYPKIQGDEWLLNYQTNIDRGRFGAPVGVLSNSYSRCYVAIRNLQWDCNKLKINAGCGVIAESIMEDEWKEMQNKIQSIKGILGL